MYCFLSLAMAALVVHHAFVTREQFYPAVVYLISSKVSVAVSAAWHGRSAAVRAPLHLVHRY